MFLSLSTAAASAQEIAAQTTYFSQLGLSPILLEIGWFKLRWYSLAYLGGIMFGYWHLSRMLKSPGAPMAQRHADDLFFYATLGIILGGRLGYATFYNPQLWTDPAALLRLWDGGMSFHGGLIGVLLAIGWVVWRNKLSFLKICDYVAVCVPAGMLFGRLANFVNGELWGKVTDVPWGIVFDNDPQAGLLPRHPSQLYQAGLEGLLPLLLLLYLFWRTGARYRTGMLVGVFTLTLAAGRFTAEFFRQPDEQLTEFALRTGLSMGQWLTLPLLAAGLFLVARGIMQKNAGVGSQTATGAEPNV